MFIDRAVIEIVAGTGGSGAEAFRREAGVPRGGPSGGDGGKGGDVHLMADAQLTTLLDFSYRRVYKAPRGMHGAGSNCTGRSGEDLILRVPPGTVAYDAATDEVVGELLVDGETMVLARGGRGGRGNARFKTATNQAPTRWEPGEEGEERTLRLELKLIADVGLVGEPNAGKSTLLSVVTAARPKIAAYPFTTLEPNLGVVRLTDYRSFVIADIPGIIEGAHEGKGLGHQFLRHIERTRVLLVMVPVDSEDVQGEYDRLRSELEAYSVDLAATPFCVGLSKIDILPPEAPLPELQADGALGVYAFSGVSQQGVPEVLAALWSASQAIVKEERRREQDEEWWTP
ncbi:MAG: GTPase ObgE [Gemmatimonadetes bacterium]|nr:GTPase ObgE [Gemmatimonadota bacterium]MDA1104248.1 GTPase ObgE [Gemmatimonadota bacterium]